MKQHLQYLIIFVSLMFMASGFVNAKSVDESTARRVACHFYAMESARPLESLSPVIAYRSALVRGEFSTARAFYVVNFDDEGFVIVAGDDRVEPILAFSTEGAFVTENIPEHILYFLSGYEDNMQYVIDNQRESSKDVKRKWKALLADEVNASKSEVVVEPLLGNNAWNQTKYYNDLCPVDETGNAAYGGHAAVGCGAVVMGQVMRYWRYPTTGMGSHSYSSNYGTLSANFGATTYHYENMIDRLTTYNHPDSCVQAIATLLYHCGVAVNMYYGPSASVANSNYIVSALSTYFRYPETVHYIERGGMSTNAWMNYLKGELDEGAPFMYGGSGTYGGHVWVCDGYRDDDFFHFNWGWGGQQNGFFELTNCSSYGFNSNHAIIIGIRGPQLPDAVTEHAASRTTAYPNPTNGYITVENQETRIENVRIYDVFGKLLKSVDVNDVATTVDVSSLPAGVYLLKITFEDNTVSVQKIVKE